jgi:Asp-tRNA(Asn)/Glu-tRNA(Gln) amidotransferase A subunit family amidase
MDTSRSLSRRSFLGVGLGGGLALAGATLLPARPAHAAAADLDFGSALGAARAIRSGQVSSVELTTRMLERIARHNPRLNAIVQLDADGARARARAADEARSRGEWWGPFHGVPCTVKETFETLGLVTTAGSPTLKNNVSPRDAAVVARLKRAGVVILGKTNVPIWAGDMQSYNAVYGQTNNPWDLTRTPGGSTGGGAAALAAGLTYLEPGSDIGGSIRTPAHFCGVYGHKPTLDIVPLRGHVPPPPGILLSPPTSLSVAGPLARSAADLRAALEVMGGPLEEEGTAWRWTLPPARAARLADYRIGYVLDDPLCPVSPDVGDTLRTAVEALRKAGATLEEGWPQGMKLQEPVRRLSDHPRRDAGRAPSAKTSSKSYGRSPRLTTAPTGPSAPAPSPPRTGSISKPTGAAGPPGASGIRTSGRTTPSSCPRTSCRHSRTTTRRTCSSASWPRRRDPGNTSICSSGSRSPPWRACPRPRRRLGSRVAGSPSASRSWGRISRTRRPSTWPAASRTSWAASGRHPDTSR